MNLTYLMDEICSGVEIYYTGRIAKAIFIILSTVNEARRFFIVQESANDTMVMRSTVLMIRPHSMKIQRDTLQP